MTVAMTGLKTVAIHTLGCAEGQKREHPTTEEGGAGPDNPTAKTEQQGTQGAD